MITRPAFPWLLVACLAGGCVTSSPKPSPEGTPPSGGQTQAEEPGAGPQIAFKFQPDVQKPWGLRVQRHRTLPAPPGSDGPALHFDTEENSRLWATRQGNGNWVLDEVLTSHAETKNGEADEDPILIALTGVTVGMEIGPDGKFRAAVDPAKVVQQISRHFPGGESDFSRLPPEEFQKELERDWRLGAQVYFDQPVHVNQPVYSLLSVSLPQLPGKYVVVSEKFQAPAEHDGLKQVTSSQEIFGKGDPRWLTARSKLLPLMEQLGLSEDDLLNDFKGTGGETVGVETMQVINSSYQGEGVFPLVTGRGTFPLRFEIEEIAGAISPPPLPTDPGHTALRTP